ncbi:MAG: excinuclease ABC subunit UvrC [Ezakiella sp.]|uniref:excinuclease ABC subunit UvrC n=1 Tax=Ezakiella sp. TaxID=1935205 RepID=UPI002A90C579|nr:excinuclease ABC subunit UvrC [Ezakiella sp.]MDY6079620.1 excinuclease ABC subunit UvrC [Ezakiella sp.]
MFNIREELQKLPAKPGVYIMKDDKDNVIYVGKAKILKNRVRSYFNKTQKSPKVSAMVSHIKSFEYIIVDNEVESLVLESNLIKSYAPKYNILLRDDKQYPYIKLTNEPFPRLIKSRELKKDGGSYFGPFPNVLAVNNVLAFWEDEYRLRTTKRYLDRVYKPCLNFYIDKCDAPCMGNMSEEDYMKKLAQPIDFLKGKNELTVERVRNKMLTYAENMEYEKAAAMKSLIEDLNSLKEDQKITKPLGDSIDYVAYAKSEDIFLVEVFFKRDGKTIGRDSFVLSNDEEDEHEMMEEFIKQYYLGISNPPSELVLEVEPTNLESLQKAIRQKGILNTTIIVPKRGEKRDTIMMVKKNALEDLAKHRARILQKTKTNVIALTEIAQIIGTGEYPERIESFDISHIQGTDAVGAMVVFSDGNHNRNDYRRFKIKEADTRNDLDCMREVLTRRYKRMLEGSKGFSKAPDLILMDGGKTQVGIATQVLSELGIDIPVMGMVKDDSHTTNKLLYNNEFYALKDSRELFTFISNVQNEVHRFAISYHKSLRGKTMIKSRLDGIKGIGPKRKEALMKEYGSIEKIKKASIDELVKVPGMTRKSAESVKEELKKYEID